MLGGKTPFQLTSKSDTLDPRESVAADCYSDSSGCAAPLVSWLAKLAAVRVGCSLQATATYHQLRSQQLRN